MKEKIANYIKFFNDQVKEQELTQKNVILAPMDQLFRSEGIIMGYIDHVNIKTGHIVIKYPKNKAPRLKVLKSMTIVTKSAFAELGEKYSDWKCIFRDFLQNLKFHKGQSDFTPLYYSCSSDMRYDYIGATGLSVEFFDFVAQCLNVGKSLRILTFDTFPPVDYLNNLANFLDIYQDLPEQTLEPNIEYSDWTPQELAFSKVNPNIIGNTILQTLNEEDVCIVQGPPGSGKSYTIAQIISDYLRRGNTVCATTMANKGLVELIKQPPLTEFLAKGLITKTNLSTDERAQLPQLKNAKKGFAVPAGELLCSTNYVLSQLYNKTAEPISGPIYDLVIIEEASQAFLASILAFKKLGKKCLIVGDPMQLPPIILNERKNEYKTWNVKTQVNGLLTYALGTSVKSYRITTTFRLTPASANLTKVFYNNRFNSVGWDYPDFSDCNNRFFPKGGGAYFEYTGDYTNGILSETASKIIAECLDIIKRHAPACSVAIISPFKDSVKHLQKLFLTEKQSLDLTVETVDRIQGTTVEYAIFYIPGTNISFALDERRFNVATSRSKSTTLIISDIPLLSVPTLPSTVGLYLKGCKTKNMANSTNKAEVDENSLSLPSNTLPGVKVVGKIDLTQFERPKKELSKTKQNYYLIDTNVFVNCPDVIAHIDTSYPIILSAKVADELDKMKIKLDEQGKRNAEKALRLLNQESRHKILYEMADTSLLPDDFDKRSPDNMILSVALKYKYDNPIILTSDNGLQLKSKILGIATVALKNFLKR